MMPKLKISAIVINYKNLDMTRNCVDSLRKSVEMNDINCEYILIDNSAESHSDLESLKSEHLDITIVSNQRNIGFSAACNQGILLARGEYVLLINNDAFMTGSALKNGVNFLEEYDEISVWCPKLVYPDGSYQVSVTKLPTIISLFQEYILLKLAGRYRDMEEAQSPVLVEAAIGAVWLVRKKDFEKFGVFDEKFYFNMEDMELSRRISSGGYKMIYDPREEVIHISGGSQGNLSWLNNNNLHSARVKYFDGNFFYSVTAQAIISLGLFLRRMLLWARKQFLS